MLEEGGVRIEHVAVDNETAVYGDPAFVPDCVVLADLEPAEAIAVGNRTYRPVLESGSLVLYEPD